jgi:hypothetical protein
MTSVQAVQFWLAAGGTANNQPGGQGQEFGSSGPVALILIIVLFIAVGFLIRSMTKHLKKVPASFDPEPEEPATDESSTDAPGRPVDDQATAKADKADKTAKAVDREKQDH